MKPLILIGRCGKETLKNIFEQEEYSDKDFNYLKRRILNNYEKKILSAENCYDVSRKIEILFSFINKAGEEENVRYLSEKIATYYYKCEGRIFWRYKIQKHIELNLKPPSYQMKPTFSILDYVGVDDKKPSDLDFVIPPLPEKPKVRFSGDYHLLPSKSPQKYSGRIDAMKEVVVDLAKISVSLLKLGIILGGIIVGIILVIKFLQMWWSNWMLLFR